MLVAVDAAADRGLVPPGLLFGVATSGFQIEGGFNGPGEPANNWRGWERSGRIEPSGVACDFWRHPEEALDRAASIGCDAFRLSVEWARIEPEDGVVDRAALDRYAEILAMCTARRMEPVVTLHHFTHPWWLGEEYWLTPGSPDRFAAHAALVVPRLAAHCRRWVTVNEPNIVALTGWVSGACPPGRRGAVADAWTVVGNLLTAHVLATREIRRARPDAEVTVNTSASTIYDYDRLLTDVLLAPRLGVDREELGAWVARRRSDHERSVPRRGAVERVLRSAFAAASPFGPEGRRGRAAAPRSGGKARSAPLRRLVEEVYRAEGPILDAVGFDWYDPVASHAVGMPGRRTSGGRTAVPVRATWETAADPGGLVRWCAASHRMVPDLPLWVVENGMATRVRHGRGYPRPDGDERPAYLRAHLGAVVEAVEGGAPIEAYLHWSLVDNYEWGSYEPRFGIFGIDRERGGRAVRWLDTDAAGHDAAGEFRRLVTAVRDGDRSAFGPPAN
jgi:beta-glucosidase/6-phospho-beta-glucosidase/beta-galactosidase